MYWNKCPHYWGHFAMYYSDHLHSRGHCAAHSQKALGSDQTRQSWPRSADSQQRVGEPDGSFHCAGDERVCDTHHPLGPNTPDKGQQDGLLFSLHLPQWGSEPEPGVCFTGLPRQQTPPTAILQARCGALLQRDQSQNAVEHREHTAMHRWACCWLTHKTKVVINYWRIWFIQWPFYMPDFYFCLLLGRSVII